MNILVTGGAGLIGSHLCRELLLRDHHIYCVDNLVTSSGKNIESLYSTTRFHFRKEDVEKTPDFRYDQIYHLASPTAPVAINCNKEMTRRVNSSGTCKMLQLAERNSAKMLFVSSIKVHGECTRVSDYIWGKQVGEELCLNTRAKIARLATTYGPGMAVDDSRVVPVFITKSLRGEPISLWNGGSQIDSFCYVSDIVEALLTFMASDEKGVIEFGAPLGISIAALAGIILSEIDNQADIKTDETVSVADACHKVVDISKAKSVLGWEPVVSLEEGLKKTINYFKGRLAEVGL
jgi:UDP-glucuronate decarboxylase